MFNSKVEVTGKHAAMWKQLSKLRGNVTKGAEYDNFKVFNTYLDVYMLAPVVGFLYGRKALPDNSIQDDAGIMGEQLIKKQTQLTYIYQLIMLLDEESEPDKDKRIERAFKLTEDTDDEKAFVANNMKIFHSYFLGGIEFLYEEFVEKCETVDQYTKRIFEFVDEFKNDQGLEDIEIELDQLLKRR